ncbi:hypothetical protein [Amycolatopsis sp. NPDC051903]|uniref:hypothetical protein n=1 Tax=Amycolatopsis sp. NPDC051903 TaxID=3363936 RepID=UPI0037ACB789
MLGLSILGLLRSLARPHDGILGVVPGPAGIHDVDDCPEAGRSPVSSCTGRAAASGEVSGPVRWFVLNTDANVGDLTTADALDQLVRN